MNNNPSGVIKLPRSFVFGIILSIFTLGFIITPYWLLQESTNEMILIIISAVFLGLVWAYVASGTLNFQFKPDYFLLFTLILILLIPINIQQLLSDIPYRGDERTHIQKVLILSKMIQPQWLFCFIIVFIFFLFLSWKTPKWAALFYTTFLLVVIPVFLNSNMISNRELDARFYLRYPFISYWGNAILLMITSIFWSPYHEIFFRITPFVATCITVTIFARNFLNKGYIIAILAGVSIATIPLLFYYSSILYLELLAVCLMVFVCFRIKKLLNAGYTDIRKESGWYALILIGFVKETVLPFVLIFILFRVGMLFYRLIKWETGSDKLVLQSKKYSFKLIAKIIAGEVLIVFSISFPLIFYIVLRSTTTLARGFALHLENLLLGSTYYALGQAFLEQFGPYLLFFLTGCILLIRKKEYAPAIFYFTLFFAYPVFHAVDDWRYVGYSRFNLFAIPAMLAGSIVVIDFFIKQKHIILYLIMTAIIFLNLTIAPINIDGSKKPMWGNYNFDTSEHYYPYREAIHWLEQKRNKGTILFTGLYSYYYLQFYFDKYAWNPKFEVSNSDKNLDDTINLSIALKYAVKQNYKVVVYQVLGKELPNTLSAEKDFHHEQLFCNMAHCLMIFY